MPEGDQLHPQHYGDEHEEEGWHGLSMRAPNGESRQGDDCSGVGSIQQPHDALALACHPRAPLTSIGRPHVLLPLCHACLQGQP